MGRIFDNLENKKSKTDDFRPGDGRPMSFLPEGNDIFGEDDIYYDEGDERKEAQAQAR